jgi:hypothetical protein
MLPAHKHLWCCRVAWHSFDILAVLQQVSGTLGIRSYMSVNYVGDEFTGAAGPVIHDRKAASAVSESACLLMYQLAGCKPAIRRHS